MSRRSVLEYLQDEEAILLGNILADQNDSLLGVGEDKDLIEGTTPNDRTYLFTQSIGGSGNAAVYNAEGVEVTEDDLRQYFEDNAQTQEMFGDFDNYMAYMDERQDLIDSGEYSPDFWNAEYEGVRDELQLEDTGSTEIGGAGANDFVDLDAKARESAWNRSLFGDPIGNDLLQRYGVNTTMFNEDGDTFKWNGTEYVRTHKIDDGFDTAGFLRGMIESVAISGLTAGFIGSLPSDILNQFPGLSELSGTIDSSISEWADLTGTVLGSAETANQAASIISSALIGSEYFNNQEVENALGLLGPTTPTTPTTGASGPPVWAQAVSSLLGNPQDATDIFVDTFGPGVGVGMSNDFFSAINSGNWEDVLETMDVLIPSLPVGVPLPAGMWSIGSIAEIMSNPSSIFDNVRDQITDFLEGAGDLISNPSQIIDGLGNIVSENPSIISDLPTILQGAIFAGVFGEDLINSANDILNPEDQDPAIPLGEEGEDPAVTEKPVNNKPPLEIDPNSPQLQEDPLVDAETPDQPQEDPLAGVEETIIETQEDPLEGAENPVTGSNEDVLEEDDVLSSGGGSFNFNSTPVKTDFQGMFTGINANPQFMRRLETPIADYLTGLFTNMRT